MNGQGRSTSVARGVGRRVGVLRSATVLMVVAIALSACGETRSPAAGTGGGTWVPPTSTRTASGGPPTATGPAAPTTAPESVPKGTAAVTWTGVAQRRAAVLVDVRSSNHGLFDRLVFQFDQAVAGYTVAYVQTVDEDPSGKAVPLEGAAFLRVAIQGATTDNAYQVGPGIPRKTYTGPTTITTHWPSIKQVSEAGDFEWVLSFGVGLTKRTGFRVTRLAHPSRLVIDIAHR